MTAILQVVIDAKNRTAQDMATLEASIEKKMDDVRTLKATIDELALKVAEFDAYINANPQ